MLEFIVGALIGFAVAVIFHPLIDSGLNKLFRKNR